MSLTGLMCLSFRLPSTPERDREDEHARQHAALQMISLTHRWEHAAAATASRSHNLPPPPPQPFPQAVHQANNATHGSEDPFAQPLIQGPNPSPRDAVAAIHAQLAAAPQLIPTRTNTRRINPPTLPAHVPLGSAAIAALRAQAHAQVCLRIQIYMSHRSDS
jgi:hypothetical protein